MNITKNGITVIWDDAEIMRMALQRLNDDEKASPLYFSLNGPPRIGEVWAGQGGVYAGMTRTPELGQYHVIIGPEADSEMNWSDAMAWAKELNVDGKNDFVLPLRNEQSLAYANVPELFKKEYYWSSVTHAAYSDGAWSQYFDDGYQDTWYKDSKYRVRAFRRILVIQ